MEKYVSRIKKDNTSNNSKENNTNTPGNNGYVSNTVRKLRSFKKTNSASLITDYPHYVKIYTRNKYYFSSENYEGEIYSSSDLEITNKILLKQASPDQGEKPNCDNEMNGSVGEDDNDNGMKVDSGPIDTNKPLDEHNEEIINRKTSYKIMFLKFPEKSDSYLHLDIHNKLQISRILCLESQFPVDSNEDLPISLNSYLSEFTLTKIINLEATSIYSKMLSKNISPEWFSLYLRREIANYNEELKNSNNLVDINLEASNPFSFDKENDYCILVPNIIPEKAFKENSPLSLEKEHKQVIDTLEFISADIDKLFDKHLNDCYLSLETTLKKEYYIQVEHSKNNLKKS
eukprot:CAMPEP_0170525156 /NCGR_PEP_ID=MMETSP0209-20121228/10609_1 /TAXON_ID=665100 ORGANISM="Litonotus pictus, Strain P1" /NCGR_SAMPLE_ID=MMETSP0209 /ASSEMBLY_ACC=CAM_ASM_000301 /LENGTH=344 /DNA_ID=CAMNT_0010814245 /DNA_START=313 /DNA_END=1343 /DNA_ORIENTATION=+